MPHLEADGFFVDVCDIGLRGYPLGPVRYTGDCAALDRETLASYSHILWFGGHSSVTSAINDPYGALRNNCLDLVNLCANKRPETKVIYASSASLYSAAFNENHENLPCSTEDRQLVANINPYDMSKFVFDYIAQGFLRNFIGLRLGTVSGWSPNLRRELLFNSMNLAALADKRVGVANPRVYRSILFLDDLYQVVRACIETPGLEDGFFNVASATATVGEFGAAIADYHRAEIELLPASPTYSFRLDTGKVQKRLNIRFNGDLALRCRQFVELVQTSSADSSLQPV